MINPRLSPRGNLSEKEVVEAALRGSDLVDTLALAKAIPEVLHLLRSRANQRAINILSAAQMTDFSAQAPDDRGIKWAPFAGGRIGICMKSAIDTSISGRAPFLVFEADEITDEIPLFQARTVRETYSGLSGNRAGSGRGFPNVYQIDGHKFERFVNDPLIRLKQEQNGKRVVTRHNIGLISQGDGIRQEIVLPAYPRPQLMQIEVRTDNGGSSRAKVASLGLRPEVKGNTVFSVAELVMHPNGDLEVENIREWEVISRIGNGADVPKPGMIISGGAREVLGGFATGHSSFGLFHFNL